MFSIKIKYLIELIIKRKNEDRSILTNFDIRKLTGLTCLELTTEYETNRQILEKTASLERRRFS